MIYMCVDSLTVSVLMQVTVIRADGVGGRVQRVMRFTVADQKLQPWCRFFATTISLVNAWGIPDGVLEHVSSRHGVISQKRCKTLDKRPRLRRRIVVQDCLLKSNISLASFLWRRPVLPKRTEVSSSTVHAEGDCLPGLISQERQAKHLIALQTVEQRGSISGLAVSLARKYEG